jgi:hypothetical protein
LQEDYVELIADLLASSGEARPTDVARRHGVSHATAIKMIGRLKREGLATGRPYRGVFLTDEGQKARRLILGLGTAMVYPSLIAAVSDASHPSCRARSLSVYRFWHDLGYAIGALSAGIIADRFGLRRSFRTPP